MLIVFSLAAAISAMAQTSPEGKKQTFTISGSATLPGVMMEGLPDNPVTDASGYYTIKVPSGWSGAVRAKKEGYNFRPVSRTYARINSDRKAEDYDAELISFIISGSTATEGVMMKGLPGIPITGKDGKYSARVPYGWSGKVKPAKEGYAFNPPVIDYTNIISNLKNQNYVAEQLMFTISDVVIIGDNPIPGVRVSASNGGQSSVSDARGRYSVKVPYGWSGKLTLEKKGLLFNPPFKSFTNVTTNIRGGQPEQQARAAAMMYDDMMHDDIYGSRQPTAVASSRRRGRSTSYRPAIAPTAGRNILVVPAAKVKAQDIAEITEDMKIMSHILDERFRETRRIQGVFIDFGDFFGRDNRATEATYLQGYGVLFSMEVNFAFSPSPKPQGQQAEQTTENVDSTWERAKQQMFSPGDSRGSRGSRPSEEYNSQMVEELKRDLITTLKHAANIRGVQPDEWIILTVIGGIRQSDGGFGGGGFMAAVWVV